MPERDENVKRILQRAAEDETFAKRLIDDRAAALENETLSETERLMLLSATKEQLQAMIAQCRSKPWYKRKTTERAGKLLIGGAALAALVSVAIPTTLGHTREAAAEMYATHVLKAIYCTHQEYIQEHGVYPSPETLTTLENVKNELEYLKRDDDYNIIIERTGENFSARAQHRTRPHTRKAFRIGPDGGVEIIEPE